MWLAYDHSGDSYCRRVRERRGAFTPTCSILSLGNGTTTGRTTCGTPTFGPCGAFGGCALTFAEKMKLLIPLTIAVLCSSCGLIPQNRSTSTTPVCRNSLRIIAAAKEQAVLAHSWMNGTPCDTPDARAKVEYFMRGRRVCPWGGTYTYNAIGVDPTCSLGHTNVTIVRVGWLKTTETRQHRLGE